MEKTTLAASAISILPPPNTTTPAVSTTKRKDSANELTTTTESLTEDQQQQQQQQSHHPAVESAAHATPSIARNPDQKVRRVQLHEYKQAALCLAEAFAKDDVARYFIDTPDRAHWTEAQKWDLHVSILEYITYAHILKGVVTTVGPDFSAVALWMPPGANADSLATLLRSGLWRLHYRLSREGRHRFFTEFLPLLHDTKLSVLGPRADAASWYLVYIGVRPAAQGRGYCRALIEDVTALADAQGRMVYLESSNERNPAVYRRFGFVGVRKMVLRRRREGGVELEVMVREPRGG